MNRVAAAAGCVLLIVACATPAVESDDQLRIVSLVPSVTEIIYALGEGGRLVGNTSSCDWPGEAREVFKVGSFYQPDLERILTRRPDIVFLALPLHRPLEEKLAELGIRSYASNPHSLAMLFAEIESIGGLLDRTAAAESLVRTMTDRLAALPGRSDTPRVYVEISDRPLMSVGRGAFLDELVRLAGARNVFGGLEREYPVVDAEQVIRLDPEVILLAHPGSSPDELRARLGWSAISAVRNSRIIADIDEDLLVRPGPRAPEGIEQLWLRLHGPAPVTE